MGDWALEVICGVHNHPLAQYLEGHSYDGRLTKEEEEYVIDMSTTNIAPKIIMKQLKTKFKENSSIMKNIYNARTKHRVVERAGRSQIQYLMGKLKDHKYFYLHRCCEKTDTIRDLFFAHPKSIDLVRAFPKVLLMDCTYKTNRYRMPLLEIVGVTPTNLTFCVACAFMNAEREDNYTWALSTLRSLMVDLCLPNLIITDGELALMRACDINKADEESRFNELLRRFVEDYSNKYQNAVKYDVKNWIDPYKEKFVSCWTNNILHYGNTTTNRVECHHSALKRQLKMSIEESERGTIDPLLCGCTLRKSYGLPCGHEISKFVAEDCPIPVDVVDGFWQKLDMEPLKGDDVKEDRHARWTECIAKANSKYDNSSPSEQLLLIKRVREAVNPITTPLIEPDIVIRTRGHPKSGVVFDVGSSAATPIFTCNRHHRKTTNRKACKKMHII
ncbi:hypothetical protein ACS0TY_021359 [Phlomoides rotata]